MARTTPESRPPSEAQRSKAPRSEAPGPGSPEPIRIHVWRPGQPIASAGIDDLAALAADPEARLWVDCFDAPAGAITSVARTLGLHPLIAEDITERNQRAKIETFDDVVHVVLFSLTHQGGVETAEIDVVLGRQFLLTVHGPEWDPTAGVPLRMGLQGVLGKGTDYLLYALADSIVDGYFPVLDRLADEIDQLQDDVMASASDWTLARLFTLKRELLEIRRATSPAREIFSQLTNRELGVVDPDHVLYFRDVYDHLIRVTDELDNYRELVAGTLDIYLTIVNNNLSVIMKRLTGVTVILAGIGGIAGIFGMSEAGAAWAGAEAAGFWFVTAAIVASAVAATVVLRRIGWI
jgi:magnesium transporter